jgi:aminoglycoside/choline kinase family phosphotransferase
MNLSDAIKDKLLHYTVEKLNLNTIQGEAFLRNYQFCCLTRNLQFLGAFSYLSRVKKKIGFEQYIPFAVSSLKNIIMGLNINKIPKLTRLVQMI